MTITINTDASYHPVYKVGAFAFWIVSKSGRVIQNGPLKKVKNSQDAELQCIANALHAIKKLNYKDVKHIYVNTDCSFGIDAILKGIRMCGCDETVGIIKKIVQELQQKHGYNRKRWRRWGWKSFISYRYVPAHTDGETKREWVNNRMDTMAKEALWQLINSKNK